MAERGRPTEFKQEYVESVTKFCLLGMTNDELAAVYEVDPRTFDRWIAEHEDFRRAIHEGREIADAKVSKSLYKRATGYTDKDGKEIPPDPRAIEFWLRNRQRHTKRWTDKQEIEITTDDATLEARLLAARKRVNDEKK